ncbi:hypothetical protein G3M48_000918 [Beauveria asiatica]|uniref:monoamine oxidase n=1 Tax=Beauveria asiatica TaxID=1069075 RepID=A0AAW0S0S2_9HYPO
MTSAAGQSIRDHYKHVHFIGTETSYVWKGYMEGAVLSGIRGAKEVIAALQCNETTTQQPTSIAATLQHNETATSNVDQRPFSAAVTPEYTGPSSIAATPKFTEVVTSGLDQRLVLACWPSTPKLIGEPSR